MAKADSDEREARLNRLIAKILAEQERGRRVDVEQMLEQNADIAESLQAYLNDADDFREFAGFSSDPHPQAETLPPANGSQRPERQTGQEPQASVETSRQAETRRLTPRGELNPAIVAGERPFGRYQIERLLGEGGMGAVYLARDTILERRVALKVPKFSNENYGKMSERFRREAQASANLHHRNICPVYDELTEIIRRSRLAEHPKPPVIEDEESSEETAVDTADELAAIAELAANNSRRTSRASRAGGEHTGPQRSATMNDGIFALLIGQWATITFAAFFLVIAIVFYQLMVGNDTIVIGGADDDSLESLQAQNNDGTLETEVPGVEEDEASSGGRSGAGGTHTLGSSVVTGKLLATIDNSIEIRAPKAIGSPFYVGDRITLRYGVQSTAIEPLQVPKAKNRAGESYPIGRVDYWIQPRGEEQQKQLLGFKELDFGPSIKAGVTHPRHRHFDTEQYVPGDYTISIDLVNRSGSVLQSLAVDLKINEQIPWPSVDSDGRIEGEALHHIGRCGGAFVAQPMTSFAPRTWSGNKQLLWIHAAVDNRLQLGFQMEQGGTFQLRAMLTIADDYGVVDLRLNEQVVARNLDLYSPSVATQEFLLGTHKLQPGKQELDVTIRGAHPDAVKKHGFGIDYLVWKQIADPKHQNQSSGEWTPWLTGPQYQDRFDALTARNQRPVSVYGRLNDGEIEFRGRFTDNPDDLNFGSRHGVTEAELKEQIIQYRRRGLREIWNDSFVDQSGTTRYCIIWQEKPFEP